MPIAHRMSELLHYGRVPKKCVIWENVHMTVEESNMVQMIQANSCNCYMIGSLNSPKMVLNSNTNQYQLYNHKLVQHSPIKSMVRIQ